MKGKNTVYKLILTAVFAALTIVGCLIQIPLPSGGMVHLGNLVIIIAALLCGGLVGGAAGGIGGFLYDLIFYSSIDGALKYLVLKFVMGFVVGSTFRLFMKMPRIFPIIVNAFFIESTLSAFIITSVCRDVNKNPRFVGCKSIVPVI